MGRERERYDTGPDDVGAVALKIAIADGEVQFGVRMVAKEGSALCDEIPDVTYDHLDIYTYPLTRGVLPWEPANMLMHP